MKKIIFSFIIFLIFPMFTLALDVDYDITNYYIDAYILENGDMQVKEIIVLDGSFNGYERDILYAGSMGQSIYNASEISDLKIYGKRVNKVSYDTFNEDFDEFDFVSEAYSGDTLKYIYGTLNGGYRYRMYYQTINNKTAFYLSYTLKDVAIMHNDSVEVYWNFLGTDFEDTLRDVNIRITLPGLDNTDVFRWWFHGDLVGNSKLDSTSTNTRVLAHIDKNETSMALDSRLLFSKDLVDASSFKKVDNNDVIDSITEEEDAIVANDLEYLNGIKQKYYLAVGLSVADIIIIILAFIYIYFKYDKERKPLFQGQYNREFIDDYNVEVIDYLMTKNITPNAMSASIMNLIYKKNISYEEITDGKKKDYIFTLNNKNNLNASEIKLVDFLFSTVGNDTTFTTKELKNYAKGTKTCDKFMSSFTSWKNAVIEDGKEQQFFEKNKIGIIVSVILLMSFIILYATLNMNVSIIYPYIAIVLAVILLIYASCVTKKTEKGIEHFARWKAFKNFLEDFGTFELKELPEIILWERYLVYATIFGLADKVEKAMNVRIKEIDVSDMNSNVFIYNHIHIAPYINSSINTAYRNAQSTITNNSVSASGGSFGGHGGGFSSGGGFGGGGGGGRGF